SPLSAFFHEDTDSLSYRLRLIILLALEEIVGKGKVKFEDVKIEHPANENYGDYSTNVAMVMAGRLKMKPVELAKKLAEELNKYIIQHQSTSSVTDSLSLQGKKKSSDITKIDPKTVAKILEKAEVAGSGFINLTIRKDYLITLLTELLNKENGVISSYLESKKIMVEFAHPNTHKELHIGHMRTLITGEALSRILSTTGAEVFRANYQGDIGPHVAKAIWGTKKLLAEKKMAWDKAEELSLTEKAHFLSQGYVEGNKYYGEEKSEIDGINLKLYQKDPSIWPVYERTREWSLDYYNEFYKRFYTKFDKLYFESEVADCGKEIILKNVGKVFEESDGAIVFPGKKYGLHTRVFVTKDGNPTYEGKDMCLAPRQFADFPFDKCIHVVANEQADYFKVIIKAIELIDPKFTGREYHLSMGMVNLVGRKISSRTGEVVTIDKLLDDVKDLLKDLIKEGSFVKQEIADILEKTTIGAVKYSVLKTSPEMNVAFDLEKSVSLEGDSGPYLMYTYARCRSVLRKAGDKDTSAREHPRGVPQAQHHPWGGGIVEVEESVKRFNPEELSLLRTLYRFPEVVTEAARTLSPNLICSFLFDLAQKYNLFYSKHSILNPGNRRETSDNKKQVNAKDTSDGGPERAKRVERDSSEVEETVKQFRLTLTSTTAKIIKQGLHLLGIETVEKM
ncbi:arginine--tRNA ligase, partial [Candidatus Gottesmanbacteria bacterium]|nr:arginine--tRNA ligase [Candidatus Gottesmanbacteria bacterium]